MAAAPGRKRSRFNKSQALAIALVVLALGLGLMAAWGKIGALFSEIGRDAPALPSTPASSPPAPTWFDGARLPGLVP